MPEAHHPHPPQRDDLWTQMAAEGRKRRRGRRRRRVDRVHLQEQITLSVMPRAHHPHPLPRDDLWTHMTSSSPWLQREKRGEEGGDEWITHPIHPPSLSTGLLRSHAE
ncbi:hypothetical protein ACOMHN_009809 [Nucella lapillus]